MPVPPPVLTNKSTCPNDDNAADTAVSAVFGDLEQRFDFVMYCFPDNVDFGGAGTYPLPLLFPKALLKMLTHVVILLYLQLLGLM